MSISLLYLFIALWMSNKSITDFNAHVIAVLLEHFALE
jgi:hypothetical protein